MKRVGLKVHFERTFQIGVVVLIVIVGFLGAVPFYGMAKAQKSMSVMTERMMYFESIFELHLFFDEVLTHAAEISFTKESMDNLNQKIERLSFLTGQATLYAKDDDERILFNQFRKSFRKLQRALELYFEEGHKDATSVTVFDLYKKIKAYRDETKGIIGQLIEKISQNAFDEYQRVQILFEMFRVFLVWSVVLGIILAGVILFLLKDLLWKFFGQFQDGIRKIGKGDLSFRIQHKERGQFGLLMDGFNLMAEKLQTVHSRIDASNQQLTEKNRQLEIERDQFVDAKKTLEDVLASKSRLVAAVSHEIRTPLSCIFGFAEMLSGESLPVQARDCVQTIFRESERLLDLVNNILDLEKMENYQIALSMTAVNIRDVFVGLRESVQELVNSKGIDFQIDIDEEIPGFVKGDIMRIRQVLFHLISNAVKFTDSGYVKLSAQIVSREENLFRIRFSVTDTGNGISWQNQKNILNGTGILATSGASYGGAGLGLKIVHDLLDLMGSRIELESEEDIGSEFSFELNMEKAEGEEPLRETGIDSDNFPDDEAFLKSQHRTFCVLVADDSFPNQMVVKAHLDLLPVEIDVVDNGQDAVRKCQESFYDFIFMDVHMPGMSGYEATQKIRAVDFGHEQGLIIGFTASAEDATRQKCFDCGMDGILVKPIRRKNILAEMARTLKHDLAQNEEQSRDQSKSGPQGLEK